MRTMWKGSISFGLVNVPIKLFSATESKSVKFRQLHKECLNPIQYKKWCPVCDREIGLEEIVNGYEYTKGKFVVISEQDLERIPDETTRTIDIVDFVDLAEIDPIYFDRSYYISPDEIGVKAFTLLKRAMDEAGKIAIAKVVIRSKQNLACIRSFGDKYMVLETMYYPDEVRPVSDLPAIPEPKIHDNEIKMAVQLISSLSAGFDPAKYTDEYRKALLDIIQAKVEGEEVRVPEAREPGKIVDLMDALRASIAAVEKEKKAAADGTTKTKRAAAGRKRKTG